MLGRLKIGESWDSGDSVNTYTEWAAAAKDARSAACSLLGRQSMARLFFYTESRLYGLRTRTRI